MAICDACNLEMLEADGCLNPDWTTQPFGHESIFTDDPLIEPPAHCHDCGCRRNNRHHPGCCVAWCHDCDEQRLFCDHATDDEHDT
jgi:hypothetical protein